MAAIFVVKSFSQLSESRLIFESIVRLFLCNECKYCSNYFLLLTRFSELLIHTSYKHFAHGKMDTDKVLLASLFTLAVLPFLKRKA